MFACSFVCNLFATCLQLMCSLCAISLPRTITRETSTNAIIHSDLLMDAGILRVEKHDDKLFFRNPGLLKLPIEMIYEGGNSKARNPRIQNMLRMIGYGENVGSGFPTIISAWKEAQWGEPDLNSITHREFVNRVQNYRKDSNMDVSDRITIEVESNPQLDKAFTTFADYIKTETLCTSLEIKAGVEGDVFEIAEGLSVKVKIRK